MTGYQRDIPCMTPGHHIRVTAGRDPWAANRPVINVYPVMTRNHQTILDTRLTPTAAKHLTAAIAEAVAHLQEKQ